VVLVVVVVVVGQAYSTGAIIQSLWLT